MAVSLKGTLSAFGSEGRKADVGKQWGSIALLSGYNWEFLTAQSAVVCYTSR